MSPGRASLSDVSVRSRRVTLSPMERAKRVMPSGPPMVVSNRFAAVLSLWVRMASHRAEIVMSAPACCSVTGEWDTKGFAGTAMVRVRCSWAVSTRCNTAAASSILKVLHMANRSSARWPVFSCVPMSKIATPSRQLLECSNCANRAGRLRKRWMVWA